MFSALVEIPAKVVDEVRWLVIDQEATRLGVTRQSFIKMWLAERLGKQKMAANR